MIQSSKIKPAQFELVVRCPECGWQTRQEDHSFESSGDLPCAECDCRLNEDDVAVSCCKSHSNV
ncbi:MAG: hypothetical protein WD045_05310 [Pirellulaceae bacterium]